MITAERLREVLHYDPETGIFVRIKKTNRRHRMGEVVGRIKADGYCYVSVDGHRYLGHRLAILYVNGAFPPKGLEVDHKDRDRSNNRWLNLRIATVGQNRANSRRRTGKETMKGVRLAPYGRFQARIVQDRRETYLGSFGTEAEAHAAYMEAAKDLHGEFARAG